jgi:quinol monooxygenase YgiN
VQNTEETDMVTVGLFVRLEAKAGQEAALEAFLKQGLQLAMQEATTPLWCALRLGPATFGIFDAFADEAGRRTHLAGPIAAALMAKADELLKTPPSIEPVEVIGWKITAP